MFSSTKIHPMSFIKAISNALELSSSGISKHHHRTAIIAWHIGKYLNISQDELEILIYSSLIHDIGAASNWEEKHYIATMDYDNRIFNHAEVGYNILKESHQLSILSEPIRYHHDRYNGGNPSGLKGEEIPLISRILHIADRIEVQINKNFHILKQRSNIISNIENNNIFDPNLVQSVKDLSKTDYFWLDIVNSQYEKRFFNDLNFLGKSLLFDIDDMIIIAEIFSKVVDATSHFTAEHSKNVAKVAKFLAKKRGFSDDETKQFYLAGLLHDLGKLAVPNEILNKTDRLTKDELDIIKQHPYYSHRILEQVDGFEKIASWVGTHHETLDGEGYPYRLKAEKIDLGSRVIAVADVFTALIEDRPYKGGMTIDEAFHIIDDMVCKSKLDSGIVMDIKDDAKTFFSLITR